MLSRQSVLHRVLLTVALVFAGALQPLRAQLDTRLQSTGPDFLDLYTQTKNLVMKPEVVTVFDFSGSMCEVMWHPSFNGTAPTSWAGMAFTLNIGNGTNTAASKDKHGTVMATGRYDVTVSLNSGLSLTGGALVRPDGSLLEYATAGDTNINTKYVVSSPLRPGENAATKASDVRNWIRCASHVRFTYSGVTHDLPICWTILDSDTVVDTTNTNVNLRQYRKSYNTSYPLKMTIINPATASNTEIEMDTAYQTQRQATSGAGYMYSASTGTAPMTSCTFAGNAGSATGNFVGWGNNYVKWLFQTATAVQVPRASLATGQAFKNTIPARTRTQAVKDAAMRTWVKYYNKVFWAYRFLKYYQTDGSTTEYDSDTKPSNDSRNDGIATDPTTAAILGASQRGWVLLNTNSDTGLKRLAGMIGGGSTPLNAAMANTLTQLQDPNNIFNDIETGADKPVECRDSYIILFTDGIPNTDMGGTDILSPYFSGSSSAVPVVSTTTGSALTGNTWWKNNATQLDSGTYYNIVNLAGLAAHGGETANGGVATPTYPTTTSTYTSSTTAGTLKNSQWIPFWVTGRGSGADAITFKKPRAITTMTVGVSLSGTTTDTTGTKYRLFAAAACGDPTMGSWDLNVVTPFALLNPNDPTQGKTANSVYFFDAVDPAKLTTSLDAAFQAATQKSNISASANPNIPFVGASLGNEVYIGKFQTPALGGPIWPGDLLMFGTRDVNGTTQIINKKGDVATRLDATTAFWSASDALKTANKLWSARKLYTRVTGGSVLIPFTDTDINTGTGIFNYVATALPRSTTADKNILQAVVQYAMGGDTSTVTAPAAPTKNRDVTLTGIDYGIMGDIINSAPAAIEYNWSDSTVAAAVASSSRLKAVSGNRFRLILVGTNQGWLHAFGEVSKTISVTDTSGVVQSVVTGAVDELWAFMPTDFLANLHQVNPQTGTIKWHPFMVDGTPAIYHLDMPPYAGGAGNGVVDSTERAIAVIGLRKGGRSYYALDIHDPLNPTMKWALVPDEATLYPLAPAPGGPTSGTIKSVVSNMGYSSCTPAFGRVQFQGKLGSTIIRDAVFLGGGFSVPDVDTNFGAKLGRSVMALDVNSGEVLAAIDMTSATNGGATVGPVSAGLIPFEYFLNSGMAQRAYFLDYAGGLWAWGSKTVSSTAPYTNFRQDTSALAAWSVRKVYQDANTALGARYTTVPAPFRVGNFPGVAKASSGSTSPTAVGVAMISGDRNNPLDNNYGSTNLAPVNHRLTVVFDRQDSRVWGLDTATGPDNGITTESLPGGTGQLANFTANAVTATTTPTNLCGDPIFKYITPGCSTYYLAPYSGTPGVAGTPQFGYFINFPSISGGFVPKGINPPMVVANSLFYTYFSPVAYDPCSGGSGFSYSKLITDVKNPIASDARSDIQLASGQKDIWLGVASDYIAVGTRSVLQGGTVAVVSPPTGASATTPEIHSTPGASANRYPKPRVWRTVY